MKKAGVVGAESSCCFRYIPLLQLSRKEGVGAADTLYPWAFHYWNAPHCDVHDVHDEDDEVLVVVMEQLKMQWEGSNPPPRGEEVGVAGCYNWASTVVAAAEDWHYWAEAGFVCCNLGFD